MKSAAKVNIFFAEKPYCGALVIQQCEMKQQIISIFLQASDVLFISRQFSTGTRGRRELLVKGPIINVFSIERTEQ